MSLFKKRKKSGLEKAIRKVVKAAAPPKRSTKAASAKKSVVQSSKSISMYDEQIKNAIKQLHDCAKLINTTMKPDIFFGRLNFLLDTLLYLQQFESYHHFHPLTPTQQYMELLENLEATVDNFIDRSYKQAVEKSRVLKTEKGRQNSLVRYANSLSTAFEASHAFWTGNNICPHYTGILYTQNNMNKVMNICNSLMEI